MQRPLAFPALTFLILQLENAAPIIQIIIGRICTTSENTLPGSGSFPGLPNYFCLPLTFSEAMATDLSALTRLETLDIGFDSPLISPKGRRLPLPTGTLLPVLTHLHLTGVGKYGPIGGGTTEPPEPVRRGRSKVVQMENHAP
jgi:hypothetical protein